MEAPVARLVSLLERLEGAWRTQGAPIADSLQPGLSEGEIDALMAPTGLELPTELRTWWGWHNGSAADHDIGPGSWLYLPLERAIASYWYHAKYSSPPDAVTMPDSYWRASWFPFTHRGGQPNHVLFVDTALPVGEVSPVRYGDEMWLDLMADRAVSVAAVLGVWLELIDSGLCWWDDAKAYWDSHWNAIPLELRQSGLI